MIPAGACNISDELTMASTTNEASMNARLVRLSSQLLRLYSLRLCPLSLPETEWFAHLCNRNTRDNYIRDIR